MAISVEYPCFDSGEPRRLAARAIWALAADVRRRLLGSVVKPIDIEDLIRRTSRLRVNGRTLSVAWDIEHAVHDNEGGPVLGVCEHDPEAAGTVMISLNADLLSDQPELLRSTAAHELGHAIFDMPAAMTTGAARVFRSRLYARTEAPIDWREWRTDEFMGAFLAPRHHLVRSLVREASALGAAVHWKIVDEVPTPSLAAREVGGDVVDAIVGALAEGLGVTESFIAVRLRKYGLAY